MPAHFQKSSQEKLTTEECDSLRAAIRDKLKSLPNPRMDKQSDKPPQK